jgi:hypothetical protein
MTVRIDRQDGTERGSALIVVLVFMVILVGLAGSALQSTRSDIQHTQFERETFLAHEAAVAGATEAIARITYGGQTTPTSSAWRRCGTSALTGYWYRTTFDAAHSLYTITVWGRSPNGAVAGAQPTTAPYSGFNRAGYTMRAIEVVVRGVKSIPNSPLYFGNGGVEKGRGAFAWSSSQNPLDPSTWTSYVAMTDAAADSYMTRLIPMRVSALDHPESWLDSGGGRGTGATGAAPGSAGGPAPAQTPHPYSIFAAQTYVGQQDCASFFMPWTISGTTYTPAAPAAPADPLYTGVAGAVFPAPTDSAAFPTAPITNPGSPISFRPDAFPVDTRLPDVQTWGWDLWDSWKNSNQAVHITPNDNTVPLIGSPNGTASDTAIYSRDTTNKVLTIGGPGNAKVAFCSGNLRVGSGWKIKGHGILVIRDDYHPDETPSTARTAPWPSTAANNTPTGTNREALLALSDGSLEWSGLVIIAGWRPKVDTTNMPSGFHLRVNGALFGEDSVQSGGEVSLDAACIQMYMGKGSTKTGDATSGYTEITYSRDMFSPGGLIYHLLPEVSRSVLSIRDLDVVD